MATKNNEGVRLGISPTQMVLVMPKALADLLGRLTVPKVVEGPTEVSFVFRKTDTGYQWSAYDKAHAVRGDTMRLTIGIKSLPEGTPHFGLAEVASYEERDGALTVTVERSAMSAPRVMSPRQHDVRSDKTPTEGIGQKFRQRLIGADVDLPVVDVSGDPVGVPPVTDDQLREARAIINRAKQERADELSLMVDTYNGTLGVHKIVRKSL